MRKVSFQELNRRDTAVFYDEFCGFWIYGSSMWLICYERMLRLGYGF